jgi:hypothetical protein
MFLFLLADIFANELFIAQAKPQLTGRDNSKLHILKSTRGFTIFQV